MPLTPIKLNNLHPFPNEPSLQGDRRRVAFVTGAAREIGQAIAVRLARDGLDVAINDIRPGSLTETKDAVEAADARCIELYGDASDQHAVARMIESIISQVDYLDVMVRHFDSAHSNTVFSTYGLPAAK